MTIAYWCVLGMISLPYIFTVLAKSSSDYSNQYPREYLEKATGWRKRAHYAQLNTFEAIPAFGLAIVIASLVHGSIPIIDKLAITFVSARIAYGIFYIWNKALLRSLAWTVGISCIVSLFFISTK